MKKTILATVWLIGQSVGFVFGFIGMAFLFFAFLFTPEHTEQTFGDWLKKNV